MFVEKPVNQERATPRPGFTLIELLVVIAIIAILVALLLPAVQQVREAARKSQCQDHMHNLGVAAHNYEGSYKRLPPSGEATDERSAPYRKFFPISFFTAVLPYVEQKQIYDRLNFGEHYTSAGNSPACRTEVDVFKCPTSTQEVDSLNYGVTDYMPVAYCDLHPTTGLRDASTAMALNSDRCGALGFCRPMAHCTDGLSNTVIIFEDGMKPAQMAGKYDEATGGANWLRPSASGIGLQASHMFATASAPPPGNTFGGTFSAPNRWADPDNANGVSGPPTGAPDQKIINNNGSPKGGPAGCPWSTNNCGPNDEPFSGHPGGCLAILGDGKVTFLSENVDRHVVRRLCTPQDGEPVQVP